jgi:hypothetical protein
MPIADLDPSTIRTEVFEFCDKLERQFRLFRHAASNLQAGLSTARKTGYSNDEIIDDLAATNVYAARKAGYTDDQIISYLYALGHRDSLPPVKQAAVDELSRRFNVTQPASVSVGPVRFSHNRVGKLLWLIGFLVLLRGLLYFLLFHVSVWVYLGFKPNTKAI